MIFGSGLTLLIRRLNLFQKLEETKQTSQKCISSYASIITWMCEHKQGPEASCPGRATSSQKRRSTGRAGSSHTVEKEELPIESKELQGKDKGAKSTRSVLKLAVLLGILSVAVPSHFPSSLSHFYQELPFLSRSVISVHSQHMISTESNQRDSFSGCSMLASACCCSAESDLLYILSLLTCCVSSVTDTVCQQ